MKTKKKFTLIELLVVIGIIAILAGLLLPAVNKIKTMARKTQAKAQIKALEIAIKTYESTYGVLPWGGGADIEWQDLKTTTEATGESSGNDDDEYDTLLQILTQVNISGAECDADNMKTAGNSRQIKFLDTPKNFETKSYVDPWGNRFVIALDLDYDNDVTVGTAPPASPSPTTTTQNKNIAIYSFGPDKTDDNGVTTGSGNDDIVSWQE
jgi:prepilin-type N-terminal cleavage/methylation domain-containing protein